MEKQEAQTIIQQMISSNQSWDFSGPDVQALSLAVQALEPLKELEVFTSLKTAEPIDRFDRTAAYVDLVLIVASAYQILEYFDDKDFSKVDLEACKKTLEKGMTIITLNSATQQLTFDNFLINETQIEKHS